MAEAGKSVVDSLNGRILYINVMNRLSVDCDCNGNPTKPDMHDIGILASLDPVVLDHACIDLVCAAPRRKQAERAHRIAERKADHRQRGGDRLWQQGVSTDYAEWLKFLPANLFTAN
jgi:uncharacterized Fe-S center protein